MPDTRPLQTYSILLEDRRIMETAAEAREPPSLVLHLLEKEWSIRPGRNQNINGPGARFSYSQPISDLLEDIQERRIPTEFTDIFKRADIRFFEGCLLVEMHDSRPIKGVPTKRTEPRVNKLILRPTAESLWADIRSIVDSQRGWGDKEALELEARIVLSTAPPLCLDPSPSVNRTANVISRSGADPSITSPKRKQSDDIEDDVESIKKRKLVQMMNPRFGKTFEPKFKILAAKHALLQKSQEGPSTATAPKNPAPPARPQANPTNTSMASMPQQVAQMAIQSNAQATAIARQRLANFRVPPDAQQAAALLQHRNRLAAEQQKAAPNQATSRNATMASNSTVPNGAPPQAPPNASANPNLMVKAEQDAMAQISSLQNGKAPFALSMPPVAKRPSTATMPSSSSPPKGSLPVPPNGTPQRTAHNIQANDMQQPTANAPTASQTPRQTPATPQVSHQPAPAVPGPTAGNAAGQPQGMVPTPGLASYHQGLVNGQQNQMHTLVQGAAGYPNGAAGGMRPVYPGMGNTYTMNGVVGRPPMMPQQVSQMTMMQQQQQMMQNAYQTNMGGFVPAMQGMHPILQQQMVQMQQMQQHAAAAVAGSIYVGQNGAGIQANPQAHQMGVQPFNNFIWGKADVSLASMSPDRIADLVRKAPEQIKLSAQWAAANERERARITLFHLYKQRIMVDNARRVQNANAANAAGSNQR